jgi:phage shock protein PspC (stress-responsive transcriptional regulator)
MNDVPPIRVQPSAKPPALRRSRHDRRIAGVLGGLADRFDLPPTQLRIGYVLLSLLSAGFPGTLVYAVLWFIVPVEEP